MPMALSNGFKVFRVIISLAVLSFSTSLQVSSVPSFKIQKPVAQREFFWDNDASCSKVKFIGKVMGVQWDELCYLGVLPSQNDS